ncbi:MAG: type II toxin-antitoxin system PemK/MazF family toxin [Demequinaceae bacterium]|nr:type II toxin-antitoxin system PemK/MazF family toxin [Demequinaceae bacterium]
MEPAVGLALILLLGALTLLNGGKKRRGSTRPPRGGRPRAGSGPRRGAVTPLESTVRRAYPGDFTGTVRAEYSASSDGNADPGEVVWTWVPFEDDPEQGKDRPVLVVGRDGKWLLSLMLTSKDHDHDAADEARWGRKWLDIGSGTWDRQGRPSEVRLDRVIRVHPDDVRREGAVIARPLFDKITRSL